MLSHISSGSSSQFQVNGSKKFSLTVPETVRALGKRSPGSKSWLKTTMLRNTFGCRDAKAEVRIS